METYQADIQRMSENIALLASIVEVPGQQEESELPVEDKNYQLPVAREKQLADDLAFLSATTDDMLKVMAVGVEEDSDKNGLTIRLASNTGSLAVVKNGFEGIGLILQQAAGQCNPLLGLPRLCSELTII